MAELLQDAHFWVGVAFAILLGVMVVVGAPGTILKLLDSRGLAVQAQLNEANKLREEAQALLAGIQSDRLETERLAGEMLSNAETEAMRFEAEANDKLAEQIKRRGELAERRISIAEAQAAAEVKAAAAELAAQAAEAVLARRLAAAKSDPLIDEALGQIATTRLS